LVHSNLFDLPGFEIALMHDGKIDGKQALSRKAVTALTTPHADIPGARLEYGYGLELEETGGYACGAATGRELDMAPSSQCCRVAGRPE
jgi:hypothetical protein